MVNKIGDITPDAITNFRPVFDTRTSSLQTLYGSAVARWMGEGAQLWSMDVTFADASDDYDDYKKLMGYRRTGKFLWLNCDTVFNERAAQGFIANLDTIYLGDEVRKLKLLFLASPGWGYSEVNREPEEQIMDCDSSTDWTGPDVTGAISVDTSTKVEGYGSIKNVVAAGLDAANQNVLVYDWGASRPHDFTRKTGFTLWLMLSDLTNLTAGQVEFVDTDADFFYHTFNLPHTINTWIQYGFYYNDFSDSGTPLWNAIRYFQLDLSASAGTTPTVYIDDIRSIGSG